MLCGAAQAVKNSTAAFAAAREAYNSGMDMMDFFLKQKEAIRKRTRQVTAMIRAEHLAWRPEKDALTVGEMLQHLWVSEEGVRRAALEGNFA